MTLGNWRVLALVSVAVGLILGYVVLKGKDKMDCLERKTALLQEAYEQRGEALADAYPSCPTCGPSTFPFAQFQEHPADVRARQLAGSAVSLGGCGQDVL